MAENGLNRKLCEGRLSLKSFAGTVAAVEFSSTNCKVSHLALVLMYTSVIL